MAAACAAVLLVSFSGCRTVGCGDACDAKCGDCCRDGRSMAFAKYDCSCDCCNSGYGYGACCGNCGCGGDPAARRPVLGRLCGCFGCGPLYWNGWFNDPPPLFEPCDGCGNYVGCGCCGNHCSTCAAANGMTAAATDPAVPPLEVAENADDPASSDEAVQPE
jgi:hypothetical protein